MRKIKLYIASSLDGKIARKGGGLDWLPDPGSDDYGYQSLNESIDTTLMGYKTYETCLSFGEWPYQNTKNYVFSRDPSKKCIAGASLITEDPASFVSQLKNEAGKDIWLVGGGELISLLHNAGLIDEYIIATIPVILGEGIELFPSVSKQQELTLQQHKVYSNGMLLCYYQKS